MKPHELNWLVNIISLIAEPPNVRQQPLSGDMTATHCGATADWWFDGGYWAEYTGGVRHYEFNDGATAITNGHGYISFTVSLPGLGEYTITKQKHRDSALA